MRIVRSWFHFSTANKRGESPSDAASNLTPHCKPRPPPTQGAPRPQIDSFSTPRAPVSPRDAETNDFRFDAEKNSEYNGDAVGSKRASFDNLKESVDEFSIAARPMTRQKRLDCSQYSKNILSARLRLGVSPSRRRRGRQSSELERNRESSYGNETPFRVSFWETES